MSGAKIMLIDDEASVLSACQRLLRNDDFEIWTTTSPEEALQKASEEEFAVIISDQKMPQMEGTRLLEKIREISPDSIRIILTGYAETEAAISAINQGAVYRFLTKPWNDDELRHTLRQAVAQFNLVKENKRLNELTKEQNSQLKELNQNLEQKVEERTREILDLHGQLRNSFLELVGILSSLTEMHNFIIGSHSKRVADLSVEIGHQLNLSEDSMFNLHVAATLHDIGKVVLPSDLLKKHPSKLSPFDEDLLRSHVVKGESLVKLVTNLKYAARVIRHHHERMDGKGYPDGLQGKMIPMESRIIAIADAFDKTLNHCESYISMTPEMALASIQHRTAREFDPALFTALANCIRSGSTSKKEGLEVEIRPRDLCVGMQLSRDLKTFSGMLLLPKDSVLRESQLEHILNFHEIDPIVDSIHVYRKSCLPPDQQSNADARDGKS